MAKPLTLVDLPALRLFGLKQEDIAPVSDADLWRILGELRAASVLDPVRLWLVGSRVEPGKVSSDVDLVLSPRAGFALSDCLIERALWYCRYFGLYVADPQCVMDPCFRAGGPAETIVPLQPDTIIQTLKLLSPKLARLVAAGQISQYRRAGRRSIEYVRRAGDTDYYKKLPKRNFDGEPSPYLRPAVEIRFSGYSA
jgi:hypothetical protein